MRSEDNAFLEVHQIKNPERKAILHDVVKIVASFHPLFVSLHVNHAVAVEISISGVLNLNLK